MSVEYVDLADYIALVAEVTGLDVDVVMKIADLGLADSALHAPAAGFGGTDKRAAWVSLRLFVELNDWTWDPRPSVDDAERAVLAIAAGEWNEEAVADWLRGHLTPSAAPSD